MSKNDTQRQNATASRQITLNGRSVALRAHLEKTDGKALTTDKDREWYCRACGHRVTEARVRNGEWGHPRDCTYHISGGVFGE
jgi:hypothetical protein